MTWTQVAQYLVMLIAFLLPVAWLSVKQTGSPLPQLSYAQQLERVTAREQELLHDPRELDVMALYRHQAKVLRAKLENPGAALAQDRERAQRWLDDCASSRRHPGPGRRRAGALSAAA